MRWICSFSHFETSHSMHIPVPKAHRPFSFSWTTTRFEYKLFTKQKAGIKRITQMKETHVICRCRRCLSSTASTQRLNWFRSGDVLCVGCVRHKTQQKRQYVVSALPPSDVCCMGDLDYDLWRCIHEFATTSHTHKAQCRLMHANGTWNLPGEIELVSLS